MNKRTLDGIIRKIEETIVALVQVNNEITALGCDHSTRLFTSDIGNLLRTLSIMVEDEFLRSKWDE